MNTKPVASILINNYNYGRFLGDAIDSAIHQTYPNTEVIVVDDGSTDNSKEIITGYGDKIIPILKENGGQASAFNAGFEASQGEVIFFLDADDLFTSEKVETVVKLFKSSVDMGWCFHPVEQIETTDEVKSIHNPSQGCGKYDLRPLMQRGKLGSPFSFPIPATSGMCFTRPLLEKLLPMPIAPGIALNDSYLKFAAMGLSQGFALNQKLALQKIHADNAFTLKDNRKQMAEICVLTAYWLNDQFPSLSKFADNLFSTGLRRYYSSRYIDEKNRDLIQKYLSSKTLVEQAKIRLKAIYDLLLTKKQKSHFKH